MNGWKMSKTTPEVVAPMSLEQMAALKRLSNFCCKTITFTSNDCG
jgi:hypothetical protein